MGETDEVSLNDGTWTQKCKKHKCHRHNIQCQNSGCC